MKTTFLKLKERGQIVILLAVVLIILLGFTALAIDGSMIYSDRRYAQNAADAAALARRRWQRSIWKSSRPL